MNGKASSNKLTQEIDAAIRLEKNIDEERMSYMTYEMKLQEMQDVGYNKGAIETTLKFIKNIMNSSHFSAEEAMKILHLDKSEYNRYLTML